MESSRFKFRAWDNKRHKMLTGDGQGEITIIGWSGDIHPMYTSSDMSGEYYSTIDLQDENFQENIELMQYTGLKDKNGVEIYEGDIIDIGYEKGVIVWYQLDAMFAYAPLTISIEATHKGKTAYQVVLDGGSPVELDFVREFVTNKDCSKGEVIGNIYENPELLKDKQ